MKSFLQNQRHLCDRWVVISIIFFLAAFLFRLPAVGRYVTPDELIWVYRSFLFGQALKAGAWADTLVAGHPGVTTSWLGALGIELQLFFSPDYIEVYEWISKLAWLTPDNMVAFQQLNQFLTSGRLLVIFVNSVGIVVIYLLARKVLGACLALLLAGLLIIDPFVAGLSGILHVDGLLSTFVFISLLSLILAVKDDAQQKTSKRLIYAAVSGGSAALAVLSKSPGLLLGPTAAIFFLFLVIKKRKIVFFEPLKKLVLIGVVWIASFSILVFLLFPALWTTSIEVFQFAGGNANRHVEEALRPTFFLGQTAFDHGPVFYPVAIAWRIGPVVTIGLVLFVIWLFRRPDRKNHDLNIWILLIVWVLLFLGLITLTAKKFDRYALPLFPTLTVLAVLGWGYWLRNGGRWIYGLFIGLISLQMAYAFFVFSYPLSAYNLMVGGPLTAQYVMPLGWGEGVSSAGSWLSEQGEVEKKTAISGIAPSLAPFFDGQTLFAENDKDALLEGNFIIFTANSRQSASEAFNSLTKQLDLIHTIRYGGLDQSYIFANPQPVIKQNVVHPLEEPIIFDGQILLLGQGIQTDENEIKFTARWQKDEPVNTYRVKLKLQDEQNHTWAELETDLLNEYYFYPSDWTESETPEIEYELDIQPTIPPGDYLVELSLIDGQSGAQLPIFSQNVFSGAVYQAGNVVLDNPGGDAVEEPINFIPVDNISWLFDSLRIIGFAMNPQDVVTGGSTTIELFWQSHQTLPSGLQVAIQIGDGDPDLLPISRFDSGEWLPEKIIQEKYRISIPPNIAAGPENVRLWLVLPDGESLEAHEIGEINVQSLDRLFSLPAPPPLPFAVRFDPDIWLRGAEKIDTSLSPGSQLDITLYWQASNKTDQPVTAFVHLLDIDGNIAAQSDRWPGGLPSNVWAPNQVIIDNHVLDLPDDLPIGKYQLAVGLYFAHNGQRLQTVDQNGQRLADDRFILPIELEFSP